MVNHLPGFAHFGNLVLQLVSAHFGNLVLQLVSAHFGNLVLQLMSATVPATGVVRSAYKGTAWLTDILFLCIVFFDIREIVGFKLMQPEYTPEPLLLLELIFKYFNRDESVRFAIDLRKL